MNVISVYSAGSYLMACIMQRYFNQVCLIQYIFIAKFNEIRLSFKFVYILINDQEKPLFHATSSFVVPDSFMTVPIRLLSVG